MTNDQPLMEELAEDPSFSSPLLGGQNHIASCLTVAVNIDLSNISPYDQGFTELFQNTFGDYFQQRDFDLRRQNPTSRLPLRSRYPELTGGVKWP